MIKNLPERKQYSEYERKINNKKVCSKISNVEQYLNDTSDINRYSTAWTYVSEAINNIKEKNNL